MVKIKVYVPHRDCTLGSIGGVVVLGWYHPTTSVATLAFALRKLPSVRDSVQEIYGVAADAWVEVEGQQFHLLRYRSGLRASIDDARVILEILAEKCAPPRR